MELRCNRSKTFCEDCICATMEEADGLAIALHRHSADDTVGRSFENLDPHLQPKFATPTFHEEVHVIGDRSIIGHVAMIRESLAVAHSLM